MEELIKIHLEGQLQLYLSNRIQKEEYDIYYSKVIDDPYWNYAYLKSKTLDIGELYSKIKEDMQRIHRKPLMYLTTNQLAKEEEKMIEKINLKLCYTDVWMVIEDISQWKSKENTIEISVNKVNNNQKEEFIQAVMEGFSGEDPEDPYESLEEGYKVALRESFEKGNGDYKVIHYLGKHKQEPVATATIVYQKDKAILYNVSTRKEYQRQGVCRKMITEIIKELKERNIKTLCLQTEKGFKTEQVYKHMGFKEIFLGKAYGEE